MSKPKKKAEEAGETGESFVARWMEDRKPPEVDPESAAKLSSAEATIDELRGAMDDLRGQRDRALADYVNQKRRTAQAIEEAVQRSNATIIERFLPIGDDLARAISTLPAGETRAGIEMVLSGFMSALRTQGVEVVASVGLPLDVAVHEAISVVEAAGVEPGVVVSEFEKGYTRGGRLLRAAKVVVAK